MNALAAMTRSWPMLGALGAGLVLVAIAAGAGGATQVALAGLGVAALGWGVLSLRAGRVLAPGAVLGVAVATLLAGGVASASGAMTDVAVLPLVAASVFTAAVALSAAVSVRARRTASERDSEPDPERIPESATPASRDPHARLALAGLALGAALVSALATPALAATEAGDAAVPHGRHDALDPGHTH